jgi:hypothetical protein
MHSCIFAVPISKAIIGNLEKLSHHSCAYWLQLFVFISRSFSDTKYIWERGFKIFIRYQKIIFTLKRMWTNTRESRETFHQCIFKNKNNLFDMTDAPCLLLKKLSLISAWSQSISRFLISGTCIRSEIIFRKNDGGEWEWW